MNTNEILSNDVVTDHNPKLVDLYQRAQAAGFTLYTDQTDPQKIKWQIRGKNEFIVVSGQSYDYLIFLRSVTAAVSVLEGRENDGYNKACWCVK